ncbi:MAG: YceI family protein [Planctomycetales bacterium]|nr:YceI family protein [Planctomycetales bacterium]
MIAIYFHRQLALPILLFGVSIGLIETCPSFGAEQKAYAAGELELQASSVYIHVGKTGFGHEHAVLGKLASGTVRLGVSENAGSLVFNMASFVADVEQARKFLRMEPDTDQATRAKVTANMIGPHVLDVAKFPTAMFNIQSTHQLPQPSKRGLAIYEFQGIFTLHGQSRPIKFPVEVEQRGTWTRLMGNFSLLQTDYGIKPFTTALGAIGVADRLTIYGDLWVANTANPVKANAQRPARTNQPATR